MTKQHAKHRVERSDFNLTREELRAEVLRLKAEGWKWWELRERFDLKTLGISTPREEE